MGFPLQNRNRSLVRWRSSSQVTHWELAGPDPVRLWAGSALPAINCHPLWLRKTLKVNVHLNPYDRVHCGKGQSVSISNYHQSLSAEAGGKPLAASRKGRALGEWGKECGKSTWGREGGWPCGPMLLRGKLSCFLSSAGDRMAFLLAGGLHPHRKSQLKGVLRVSSY